MDMKERVHNKCAQAVDELERDTPRYDSAVGLAREALEINADANEHIIQPKYVDKLEELVDGATGGRAEGQLTDQQKADLKHMLEKTRNRLERTLG